MSATSEGKVTLSAAVPMELKERIQHIAAERRWTLSQTLVIFLEEYLEDWENELGLSPNSTSPSKKNQNLSDR